MAQTLQTNIVINAQTGNGFSQVGATLSELGSMVNGISQELIEFGKDSINVYRDYEKSMKDAEVALSTTYGRGTRELSTVMSQLDASATEWAASTIFHTDDVANAISEAAHAGWDYEQIMTGIPAAMQLAQAGGLDLSEAVNYIVKSTSAAGVEFENLNNFIDLWAFASNSSASTIGEFGDAMLRMGSSMRFAANPEELMTLIAVTANAGATGSEAGTLIRNSMMRLVAPTKKAKEAMAELGATSDEASVLLDNSALAAANAELAAHGFSAYDQNGNLKSILDTYRELYLSLGDIAGGFENIENNESALGILSAIFPTRTIQEALTLLRGAADGYDGLYEAMMGGDAAGYGVYSSETMMDTLFGAQETFESKIERLKQAVGEELAPQLEAVYGSVGGIIDSIAGLDDTTFSALVTGLETLAGLGPGLLIAGTGARLIGSAMSVFSTPVGGAVATAAAMIAASIAISTMVQKIEDANFEENFGNLELDTSAVQNFVSTMHSEFESANQDVDTFNRALESAVQAYQETSADLKSKMLTSMVTDETLTEDITSSMFDLGENMSQSLLDGIKANFGATNESMANAFAFGEGGLENPIWTQIQEVMEAGYENVLARAEELGTQLREAMTKAFADGKLNADEIANIQAVIDEQNKLMAQQQEIDNYVERQRILRKGQTLGLDAITDAVSLTKEERDAEWETMMQQQDRDLATMAAYYDSLLETGGFVTDPRTGKKRAIKSADKTAALEALKRDQEAQRTAMTASGQSFIMDTMLAGIGESDLSDTWGALSDLATNFREAGGIVTQAAANTFNESVSGNDASEVARYLNMMVENLGGYDELSRFSSYYREQGNETAAGNFQMLMDMYDIMRGTETGNVEAGTQGAGDYSDNDGYKQLAEVLSGFTELTPESLAGEIQNAINSGFQPEGYLRDLWGPDLYSQIAGQAPEIYQGASPVTDWATAVQTPNIEPVEVQMQPDTSQMDGAIEAYDGRTLTEYVHADTSAAESAISSLNGRMVTVHVQAVKNFASGGRATTASIFGEAGPEWAIPEEHSERTADLLNQARAASGFSWEELLDMYGGLNSNTNSSPTTLIYSPTIQASDVTGVEQALLDDKKRLDEWWSRKQMHDEAEVYA